jgi:ACS family tartrate transporter-like MFS transporter
MGLSSFRGAERAVVLPDTADGEDALARRTLGKAAWRLIPLLAVCYVIAYMDRVNVSYAALQMNRSLGFNAEVYGFGAGVFFLSYAACEIPSNYLLLRFGARRWIARIMVTWGLIAGAMVFVRSPASFYTLRFLLGMAEAGFFPGVLYYLAQWFPPEMRARAVSRFYVAIPLSSMLMGLIAGSLLKLNGRLGLKGWQWLFLVEALPAIVLGVVIFFALPDGPETAAWLEPEEKKWLQARLGSGEPQGHRSHAGLFRVLKDPRVVLFGTYHFCGLLAAYAFTFAAPMVFVELTRWNAGRVGFVLAGISMLNAIAMVTVGHLSDTTGRRIAYVAPLMAVAGVAYLVSGLAQGPHAAWIVMAAVTVATMSYYGTTGVALSLIASFLEGPPAAIGIAAINTIGIMGGFVGPYWMGWSTVRSGSYRPGWGLLVVPCVVAAVSIVAASRGRWGRSESVS